MVIIVVRYPSECKIDEIQGFTSLVAEGGEVQDHGLETRIKGAFLLGFAIDENETVAVAAIKRPSRKHTYDFFKRSGTSQSADDYSFEYGWAFTKESHRKEGLASTLLEKLLANAGNCRIWASTRETNRSIHNILEKQGFERTGKAFRGRNESLILWVKHLANSRAQPISKKLVSAELCISR